MVCHQFFAFGSFTGGYEDIRLAQSGGMLLGLQQHFSFTEMVRGLATVPVTWVWAGTWSLARMPTAMQFALVLLALWVVTEFLTPASTRTSASLSWPTVLMSAGLCLGLAVRTFQGIAVGDSGHSGGWYLHILMPWVAIAMGEESWGIFRAARCSTVFFVATIFALGVSPRRHLVSSRAIQRLRPKGDDKLFHFSTGAYCLDRRRGIRSGLASSHGRAWRLRVGRSDGQRMWLYHSVGKSLDRTATC